MGIELKLAIKGNLKKAMEADFRAGQRAATREMRRLSRTASRKLQRQAKSAGFVGEKPIEKSIQSVAYPQRGFSFEPTGIVYTNPIRGSVDIYGAFQGSKRIVPRRGRFIRIPTPETRRLLGISGRDTYRTRRVNAATLTIIDPSGQTGRIVDRRNPRRVYYWLVREVVQPGRLSNPTPIVEREFARFGDRMVAVWERETKKEFARRGIR